MIMLVATYFVGKNLLNLPLHKTKRIMGDINWLSFILTMLIPMAVGFVYYGNFAFGKIWMKSIGMTEEKIKEANMGVTFGISLLMAALMTFFLLNFNNSLGQEGEFDTFGHGAAHGAILSVFLVIPIFVTNGLFEQKSWTSILLNCGYWILTLALMGGVIDVMHHWPNA
jgi:cytochrome b561